MRSLEQLAADWLEEARVLVLTKDDDFPAFIVLYPRGEDEGHTPDIDRYVFVTEAWLAAYDELPPGRQRPAVMPVDRPDRRELIFVLAQHEDGGRAVARAEIFRLGETATKVTPLPTPDGTEFDGDLGDFFNPPPHVREHVARCKQDPRWGAFVEGLGVLNVKVRGHG